MVILTSAEATKLQTERTKGKLTATKVEYITEGNQTFSVSVGAEVIISAGVCSLDTLSTSLALTVFSFEGTVKTPQVLEQSGNAES